jgi:hypothetical protein
MPVTFINPDIFHITPSSGTPHLCSARDIRDQLSKPYQTAGKIRGTGLFTIRSGWGDGEGGGGGESGGGGGEIHFLCPSKQLTEGM